MLRRHGQNLNPARLGQCVDRVRLHLVADFRKLAHRRRNFRRHPSGIGSGGEST
jgi:hypothetical protein